MEYFVNLTEQSVYRILKQRAYSSQYGRMSLIGGVILIFLGVVLLLRGDTEWIYTILMFILGIALPCSVPVNLRKTAKMSTKDTRADGYEFGPNGVRYTHLGKEMFISWDRVGYVAEYPTGMVFDLRSNQITLIPRGSVSDETYAEMKNEIERYHEIVEREGKLFKIENQKKV